MIDKKKQLAKDNIEKWAKDLGKSFKIISIPSLGHSHSTIEYSFNNKHVWPIDFNNPSGSNLISDYSRMDFFDLYQIAKDNNKKAQELIINILEEYAKIHGVNNDKFLKEIEKARKFAENS